eukprot:XP_001693783.1 exostosin-like glycosyltransferase [Chlamydomonas reinhardtii]
MPRDRLRLVVSHGARRLPGPPVLSVIAIALAVLAQHTRAKPCAAGCTVYGTCNEELGRCDCPRNRTGPACHQPLSRKALAERCRLLGTQDVNKCNSEANTCINGCHGPTRGACVAGFCHCRPGYFGNDCALSLGGADGKTPVVLSDRGYTPRAVGPRVYIYDLPPELTTWRSDINLDRWTIRHFLEMLTASGARVADGAKADWYFIPVRLRSSSDAYVLQRAIHHLRHAHPWFNATGGGRHFVIAVGDMGRLESERGPLSANVTFVSHWGLASSKKAERLNSSPWRASHRNATDIVLPVYISLRKLEKYGITRSRHHPKFATMAPPEIRERNGPLFWFAGRICQDRSKPATDGVWPNCPGAMGYSAMTRQAVHFHHWDRPGYFVAPGDKNYSRHLLTSKFCFGAMGGGHGQRQLQAALAGCVPVVIGDGVLEAWEPYLDWNDFGVRVAEADIPRLHTILGAIGPEEYARKLIVQHQRKALALRAGATAASAERHSVSEALLGSVGQQGAARHGPAGERRSLLGAKGNHDHKPRQRHRPAVAQKPSGMAAASMHNATAIIRPRRVCSVSPFDTEDPAAFPCRSLVKGIYSPPPGGLICAGVGSVSQCPRLWS